MVPSEHTTVVDEDDTLESVVNIISDEVNYNTQSTPVFYSVCLCTNYDRNWVEATKMAMKGFPTISGTV